MDFHRNFNSIFNWISNGFPFVFHWNVIEISTWFTIYPTGIPLKFQPDFYLKSIETSIGVSYKFQLNFQWISICIPFNYQLDLKWISIGISLKFHLDFKFISIGISLKFPLVYHWNLNWISNGFPFVFLLNINWI